MIRLRCPHCQKIYEISPGRAGRSARCKCGKVLRIPAVEKEAEEEADYEVVEEVEEEDEEDPAPARRKKQRAALEEEDDPDESHLPHRRPRREEVGKEESASEEEEEETKEDPRPRKGFRPKRSAGRLQLSSDQVALAALGIGWVILLVATRLTAYVGLAMAIVGIGLSMTAGIWLLVIGRRKNVLHSLLMVFVPFYMLVFVILHFKKCWRAVVLHFSGLAYLITAILLLIAAPQGSLDFSWLKRTPPAPGSDAYYENMASRGFEARRWLDVGERRQNSPEANHLVEQLYNCGARKVYLVNLQSAGPLILGMARADFLVELPDDPASRQRVFQTAKAAADSDTGQRYILINGANRGNYY